MDQWISAQTSCKVFCVGCCRSLVVELVTKMLSPHRVLSRYLQSLSIPHVFCSLIAMFMPSCCLIKHVGNSPSLPKRLFSLEKPLFLSAGATSFGNCRSQWTGGAFHSEASHSNRSRWSGYRGFLDKIWWTSPS